MDNLLEPQNIDSRQVKERKERQKAKQKQRYDQHARDLPELYIGQHVRLLDIHTNRWSEQGVVKAKLPNRSYLVQTEYGVRRRRNRRHIRPASPKDMWHEDDDDELPHDNDDEAIPPAPAVDTPSRSTATHTYTRSGRRVKPPDRLIEQ